MEPLGVPSRTVCADKLPRWGSACTDLNSNLASGPENAAQLTGRSPFTCRPDVNKKIVLWVGEVALLDCQAVVNTTSERLSDRNPVNESMSAHAGPQLHEELRKLQGCRTGEVRVTKGCGLAARFILHTVGPRFDPRYRTAAEMQLHHCYRQALLTAMERGLTSLGLCIINTEHRGFPPEGAAHIALRTVRRFLENNPEGLSTVVFAVSNAEQALYSRLLPLYFPRSPGEEVSAHALLPQEVGDSNGEPLLPDRQIRISDSPLGGDLDGHEESDEDFELSRPGRHPFAQMEGNHDRLRHLSLQAAAKTHKGPVNTIRERGYQQWLQQAKTEDLSDIAALRAFYQAGVDGTGCPVVAIIGRNIPVSTIDLEKALLYFIRVMDPVASSQFILLCFLTGADPGDRLGAAFLRRICATLHYKYHRNLKAVYIVHPSLWSKVLTWFLAMSVAGLRGRVCNISQLHQLFVHIPHSHIDIPQFVWDYDHRITGESNVAERADPADSTDAVVGL